MSRVFARSICGFCAVLFFAGCPGKDTPVPEVIKITATPTKMRADGVASAMLVVSRKGTQDVTLRVGLGTFKDTGNKLTVVVGGSGSAELISCDSRIINCSGLVRVTASSEDGASGEASVEFQQLELCNDGRDNDGDGKIDCADEECVDLACALPSTSVGTGKCSATGLCLCSTGVVETCNDGVDNNCDGKVDCADTTCDTKICKLPAGTSGKCAGTMCKCPGVAEICDDGIDDDCDGLVDCMDPDCQSVGGNLGKICDTNSHSCGPADAAGAATCTVCAGGQTTETTCNDGKDNDCDGKVDCSDPDCDAKSCAAFGKVCNGAQQLCLCGGGGAPEAVETTCNDGKDNDCDGTVDCADTSCVGPIAQVCGTFGKTCQALNVCGCGATVEDCKTPGDDNCNGLTNCEEIACRPSGSGLGAACDLSGHTCSQILAGASSCSVCSGNGGLVEAAEGSTGGASMTCGDGKDNDCDGTMLLPSTDCQDPDCNAKPCNLFGSVCSASSKECLCPTNLKVETGLCGDGKDNDCDGKVDCADLDCQPLGNVVAGACGANGFACTASGSCACSGNGGFAEPAGEVSCNDGKDNDCDGLSDCADPDCRPVGNNPGKVCDVKGNTCSNPSGGVSSCNVCSGNGGQPQTAEFSCGDNKDNDCDGKVDCQDPGCGGLACSSDGRRCVVATGLCVCPGPEAGGETSCGDGLDNDCDGKVDCADPDCQPINGNLAKACSTTGKVCSAAGTCDCSGNGGVAELTEGVSSGATCGDGFDNDCDGVIDCADSNCRPAPPATPTGKNCSQPVATPPTVGKTCDVTGVCICPGGQAQEASCSDLQDNDCDGLVDCADSNCIGRSCSANGKTCSSISPTGCSCPSGLTNEASNGLCSNGIDDDCDGLVDCLDPDCVGKQCNTGNVNYLCNSATPPVCQDQTSLYSLVVTATSPRIPADGVATTVISAVLKNGTSPVAGVTVTFAVSAGPGSVGPLTGITDATGKATTVFTAGTIASFSTITASYSGASGSTAVEQPRVGQVKFISQQFSVMGVRFSSFQETNILTFQVLDTSNGTYPAGLSVAFTHSPIGGSFLGSTATCSGAPLSCTATGVTDGQGFVTVALHSGTVASVVSVRGDASAGGGTANATASNIAIVGAKASGLHVSLDCTPKNIPAFNNNDCTNSYVNTNISCRAAFADRFNNVLGVPTLATFSTEAGAAGPPATTASGGIAIGFVSVGGFALPADVAPFGSEASLTYTNACGIKTHNPRDGLVSIIVSAIGEEGFVDGSNGFPANGIYDLGENFVDQGEPFVDVNDNGIRDANEAYVDANNNNGWDGPNGVWDVNTVVWAETRVIYTGAPDTGAGISKWLPLTGFSPPYTGVTSSPFTVSGGPPPTSEALRVYFADLNFNQPEFTTAYSLTVVTGSSSAVYTTSPLIPVDNLGLSFTQQFCTSAVGAPPCGNTCAAAPCYTVGVVGNYSYGTVGVVNITGGTVAGPVEVRANATFNGVTVPISRSGTNN